MGNSGWLSSLPLESIGSVARGRTRGNRQEDASRRDGRSTLRRLRSERTEPARPRRTRIACLACVISGRRRPAAASVPRVALRDNPQLSTDAEFVESIASSGSQGRLGGEGIRAALYALYRGESEVGFYGLEAESTADADRFESLLRGVWAHNGSLHRARVHRGGKVLVVVWTDGVSASCWKAVNGVVVECLPESGVPIGPEVTNPQPR